MSENIDSLSNNLCIPEDAFEQFQAVSMYQEEKYITLPAIASEKPKELDPGELSILCYDNEVVVTTEDEVNSTVNDVDTEGMVSSENQTLDNTHLETDVTLEDVPNVLCQDYEPPKLSRRGRKKKHIDNGTDIFSNNFKILGSKPSKIDIQEANELDQPVTSSTVPRKRGRKPKPKPATSAELSEPITVNYEGSNVSNTPFSSDPENSDNITNIVKRKRGRPRKTSVPNDQMKEITSDKDLSSDLSGSDNRIDSLLTPNKLETPTKGKRGRPRKVFNIENQVKHTADNQQLLNDLISIEHLNETQSDNSHEKRKENLEPDLTKIEQIDPDSKLITNSDDKPDTENTVLTNNFSKTDEHDNIKLSDLKMLCETTNIAEENCASEKNTEHNSANHSYEDTNVLAPPEPSKKGKGRTKKGKTSKQKKFKVETIGGGDPIVGSSTSNNDSQPDADVTDNLSLSELKALEIGKLNTEDNSTEVSTTEVQSVADVEIASTVDNVKPTPSKRNTKMPAMSDFEYNVDSVVEKEITENEDNADNSLLVEDTSKRPIRKRVPKLRYDEESDEDPFANVELSDDDEPRRKKGNRYYSDDEYVPGRRGNYDIESTDSDANELIDETIKLKRKKLHKKSDNQSPRKKGKASEVSQDVESDDVEICLQPSVIKTNDDSQSQPSPKWGTSNEFENFLAKKIQGTNLKIKKLSATDAVENKSLEIPVIDPEARKTIEISTQTKIVNTASTGVQTTTPYDIPMKENITLTPVQSEKACYFLNSIVKTTSELGILMTQKSEDFIKKKINTTHVTDTLKMDYCVKKSFLLFKLAKHNLMQMEEDLAKQYDEFLKSNNLTSCREEQNLVAPSAKEVSSDSDCEIVEEPVKTNLSTSTSIKKTQNKPKFNPKTVFLNKELSIKIAKKPTETKIPTDTKKLDIKGRHTVWINDTVMVKKVKPTQSFLAQDSRNKKPPDNFITTKMVSDFFKNYDRQKALSVCRPFVTTDWLSVSRVCVCNYFIVKPIQFHNDVNYSGSSGISTATNASASETTHVTKNISNKNIVTCPETLLKICLRVVKNQMHGSSHVKEVCEHIQNDITDGKNEPVTLLRLSLRALNVRDVNNMDRITSPATNLTSDDASRIVLPLKTLCHQRIVTLLSDSNFKDNFRAQESHLDTISSAEESNRSFLSSSICVSQPSKIRNEMKSLLSLCVEFIQKTNVFEMKSLLSLCVEFIQQTNVFETSTNSILLPKSLKSLTYEFIKQLLYGDLETGPISLNPHNVVSNVADGIVVEGLTINSINTLSEEAFFNLEESRSDIPNSPEYLDNGFDNEELYEPEFSENDEENQTETSWVSQVQMQELRSCFNTIHSDGHQVENISIITQIKLEPVDDVPEILEPPTHVKTEPIPGLDEITIIPNIKPEVVDIQNAGPVRRSNSYDVDKFEQFVACNKIMHGIDSVDIFSQSALRVRRQHEPDYEEEDTSMSLLVPQTYEPLSIETVKGSLMESSSDEEGSKNKKVIGKKKPERRIKGKQKKPDPKTTNKEAHPLTTDKPTSNEVATLTKRMKDRIRQEEKKDDSTDSDTENIYLNIPLRLRKKKEQDKTKLAQTSKAKESEIQCNNVDSTDHVDDNLDNFTGFTAIDQNEISTYQKYMKYVYDKIIPEKVEDFAKNNKDGKENKNKDDEPEGPLIAYDEPVELLECEPTMPIFDDSAVDRRPSRKSKGKVEIQKKEVKEEISKREATLKKEVVLKKHDALKKDETLQKGDTLKKDDFSKESPSFIERHGWKCYPVNTEDSKLYLSACVALEKLPESFVQTYFEYQGITSKDENDEEIARLTNLNSLKRTVQLQNFSKTKVKSKKDGKGDQTSETGSRPASPTYSDHYDELEPSDDEGAKVEDEVAPPIAPKHAENSLAKNLLMNDNDSDSDSPIMKLKEECSENANEHKKSKPSSKGKKKQEVAVEDTADLMLTADKMMNKELTLLHAPVVVTDVVKDVPSTGPVTRNKQKSASKQQSSSTKTKAEEDSSSEEEKQWVTTKEKLLKRMGKKDTASLDDAKRAKLVSEFIERRGDLPDSHMRNRPKARRSRKKFLERQKQLGVLSRELFGESSDAYMSKRSQKAQASLLYKGRRNIRKVIDKKSLARSTVVANMEEFERKRRLNARQTKLRELLGCEEGVNVLVINDEVCLEYDFEENRPVVTVHPFFTKVMKAHQYEGVKFMWDACFESLSEIAAGHPGGGCILAHCMGLGKTLQVLALLHTVLTHPGVKMQRVLVCCPLSTVLNWVDEIHKWIGPVTNEIKVFELSKLKKTYERAYQLEDWYNGGGIFIIGYELFRSLSTLDPFLDDVRPTIVNKIRTALLDPGPDIIVCDEGHLLKNDCSVLAVAMSRVVTKRRIILTGTPMQNNLREYYCMVNFVKPNLLGTYAEYSNRFENPIMNGQHRDSSEEDIKLMKARTHILHKVLEGCLQRQEVSVLYPYLPKKHEYTVFITLTPCQWDLYKHYLNNYATHATKQNILKDFHILQKIWSHPQVLHYFQTKVRDREERNKIKAEKLEDDLATEDVEDIKPNAVEDLWWLQYLDGGNMLETLDSSNKFVVVFRILDECIALGDKVLIFSTSLFCLDALEYFLKKIKKWSLGHEYFRLDGSVPAEVRQKWCREFNVDNNYKTKLFLVSTRAGCLGLNMTAANRVIIMDTSWNPAHDIQSIFRVYRFGQKKDCYIYRLVAMGTMEQKIYERSVTKQAVACRVVDEQQIDRHYNMAELTELYKFDEGVSCVAGGVAVGVRDVVLLRVARETALHAVHEHDSLLRGSSEQGLPEHERNAAWMQFQQEQAHKQMENHLILSIPNIPNAPLKRLHGHDYARSPTPTTEIKKEDTSEDYNPNEPKAKKGKKQAIVKCKIPIQADDNDSKPKAMSTRGRTRKDTVIARNADLAKAGTSKENTNLEPPTEVIQDPSVSLNQEEIMVEKITDILLKYNFQNRKGNSEISKLVAKVRNMVKKGFVTEEDMSDDLTASIARILLPKQVPLPKVTDIMCESINNSAAPGARRKDEEPELITSDPTINVVTHRTETTKQPESRTKRKAAIAAEKSIDSLAQDVIINLDDDEWDAGDTDFMPDKQDVQPSVYTNKSKRKSKNLTPSKDLSDDERTMSAEPSPENSEAEIHNRETIRSIFGRVKDDNNSTPKSKPGPKSAKERMNKKQSIQVKDAEQVNRTVDLAPPITKPVQKEYFNSILLSDEEDLPSNPATSQIIPEVSTVPEKNSEKEKPVEKPPEDDEILPLPLYLLRNEHFINIVSHTYLAGNPMLDEDAANLAAQYSTLKALQEAERTGKDVCSGPIYDIAVKVIGKEGLRIMRKTDIAATSIQSKENVQNKKNASENAAKEPAKSSQKLRDDMIKEKLGMPKSPVRRVQTSVSYKPTVVSISNEVVPVGLIQTSAGISASQSFGSQRVSKCIEPRVECILPDDDDVIISDVRATPAPPARTPSPSKPSPIILNHTLAQTNIKNYESPYKVTVNNVHASTPIKTGLPPNLVMKAYNVPTVSKSNLTTTSASAPLKAQPVVYTPVVTERDLLQNDTICLDSDDEETITPTKETSILSTYISSQQAPVPVSLTMANAPGVKLPLPPLPNQIMTNQNQPIQSQTLVLRQVMTTDGIQPKYILVPTDKLPIPKLPNQLVAEKPKSHSAQLQNGNFHVAPGESILTASNGSTLKTSACKPGDILRISKTGVIEVVNRIEMNSATHMTASSLTEVNNVTVPHTKPIAPTPPPQTGLIPLKPHSRSIAANPKPSTSKSVDLTTKVDKPKPTAKKTSTSMSSVDLTSIDGDTPKPTAKKSSISGSVDLTTKAPEVVKPKTSTTQIEEINKSQRRTDARKAVEISSSSSSIGPRALSPDNPLSILKDVVHIRASDYPTTSTESSKYSNSSNNKSIVVRTEKSSTSNISVQHMISEESKNTKTDSTPPVLKLTPIPKSKVPKHVDSAAEKQIKKEALIKRIAPFLTKNQPKTKEEPKPRGKNTINFDNLNSSTNKLLKNTVAGKTTNKKADVSKGSKGINMDIKPGSSQTSMTVDLTNMEPIEKLRSDAKKRASSSADTTPVKKKKPPPMTLQDFDLDDIDDIIELE